MKILLVNSPTPHFYYNREFYPPLNLLYIAAVLEKNNDTPKILDFKTFLGKGPDPTDQIHKDTLLNTISNFNPELVGFGCLFSGMFPDILKNKYQ